MCKSCHEVLFGTSGCAIAAGTRNEIVPGPADVDHGQDTKGTAVPSLTENEIAKRLALISLRYQRYQSDREFDFSHPVDEYQPQGGNAVIVNTLTIQPDYDQPERIDTLTVITPVGATACTVQLGQRTLVLYSGVALTAPLVQALEVRGIILNSDDLRVVTWTGTVTTPGYFGLTGFALTRGQFS